MTWSSAAHVDEWLSGADQRQAERGLHFWLICQLLPFAASEAFKFADLGAGGGALASAVLDTFPPSSTICVNGSAAMIERARSALASYGERVQLIEADFSRGGWAAALGEGQLNAVVSYQAIHNLFNARAIRRVYRGVCAALAEDGLFIACDNIASASLLQERIDAAYRARRALPGGPAGGVGGCTLCRELEDHLTWLRRVGFRAADCPWRELQRAMLVARK
jgi:Methyltransferase domain